MDGGDNARSRLHELHVHSEGLDSFLAQLAVLAADTVEGDSSCSVSLLRGDSPLTVAPSDERTTRLDELQYSNGDGPCLHCARTGQSVVIEDLSTDGRWPAYAEQARGQGLAGLLSMPLDLGDDSCGALSLYVFEPHRFSADERTRLGAFADETSWAISLALRHDQLIRQTDHLHAAMASRRVIDQALGIIMAQNRCSADEAFAILRRASNHRNVKIQQLSGDMIRSMTGTEPSHDTHWQA